MSVEAPVCNRLEIGDQAIHRVPVHPPSYQPDATAFHVDNTMRFVRAEIACNGPSSHGVYVSVKNTGCEYKGIRWATSGGQPQAFRVSRSTNWQNALLIGLARFTVVTVEIFVPNGGGWAGRITALGVLDYRLANIGMQFEDYDPDAGFDIAVMQDTAKDVFVMSYHVNKES